MVEQFIFFSNQANEMESKAVDKWTAHRRKLFTILGEFDIEGSCSDWEPETLVTAAHVVGQLSAGSLSGGLSKWRPAALAFDADEAITASPEWKTKDLLAHMLGDIARELVKRDPEVYKWEDLLNIAIGFKACANPDVNAALEYTYATILKRGLSGLSKQDLERLKAAPKGVRRINQTGTRAGVLNMISEASLSSEE